jgi:hypothetical protein
MDGVEVREEVARGVDEEEGDDGVEGAFLAFENGGEVALDQNDGATRWCMRWE